MTPREREALMEYARTGDVRQAAYRLGISHHWMRTLLWSAYQKLGVTGAISAFRELGWLALPFETRATGVVASGIDTIPVALR